jgi:8-oxo-dGTP diphosphatase
MAHPKDSILVFGKPIKGYRYIERPGAYAIILDEATRVAVVKNPLGYFLPGGGQEPGESPEETAKREVLEECGFSIEVLYKIGNANQYISGPDLALLKQCIFFRAQQISEKGLPTETDHELHWFKIDQARTLLSEECQVWALTDCE